MTDFYKTELKPCPFCGCKQVSSALMPNMKWIVGCLDCGVRTKEHDSLLEAAGAWNRRADPNQSAPVQGGLPF